jgi:hypothetical protein
LKIDGIGGDVKLSKCGYCGDMRPRGILWLEKYAMHARAIVKLPNGLMRCFPRCEPESMRQERKLVLPGKVELILPKA